MNERRIHQLFAASVLLKGAHALLECASGIALALINTAAIVTLAKTITQDELTEDPRDFIANHLLAFADTFSISSQHFYAFYLLSHGAVKVFLVIFLLKNKLWAYPVSLGVLGLFILYQVYRFSYTHSIALVVLTVFDLVVMVLIWHEYRLLRHGAITLHGAADRL
ncbi:MAG: DUF2127 domain-containing protein [Candidimonas sp.]|nr:MAG: DUF2127 domain-containing protein [Candidimonas sp.]TAM20497.1 MAG: DUF2127 domain-containing protein [Candidimonas sp.]TAM77902.1 MAG: DUF2127 domain-containing protein [Candidimonas sp.]